MKRLHPGFHRFHWCQHLDIVKQFPERFKVVSLAAGVNIQLLKQQILQFRPKMISVLNKELSETLRKELASFPTDIVHA